MSARRALWLLLGLLCACRQPAPEVDQQRVEADGHFVAGQVALQEGQYARAHQEFQAVRALRPSDTRLDALEGEAYLAERNVGSAVAAFEKAVKAEPQRASSWTRLGYLYSLQGKVDEAHAALESALKLDADDYNALELLGDLAIKEGRFESAAERLVNAARRAPERFRVELTLKAHGALRQAGKRSEAAALLEEAVGKGLQSPALWAELAEARVAAGQLAQAADAYRATALGDKEDPSWWEFVAELELKLNRPTEAAEALRKSLAVKDRAVVHVALGRLCLLKRDFDCARRELDLALQTASGEELRETTELAEFLVALGRSRDALALLKSVSEEREQQENVELQLQTARLAKTLKDGTTIKRLCERLRAQNHECP